MSYNAEPVASKFFLYFCRIVDLKHWFTNTNHPQCNGHAEWSNWNILPALHSYVAIYPKNWDFYVEAVAFAYKTADTPDK